jgi:hypothetical protein
MPTGNLQVIINAIDKKIEDIQKAHPIPVSFTDQEKVFMSGIKERWQSKFNDIGFCGRDARMLEFFRSRDFTELCKNRELLEKIFTVEARGETYPTEYVKMSSEAIDVTLGSILRFGLKATESTDWLEIGTENADGGLEINGTKSEEREKLAQERRKRYQENTAPALQNLATALGVQDEFNTAEPKSDYSGNLLGRWENIKKFLLETIDDNDAVILAGKILFVPNYTPGSMADQAHWWMRDTFGGQDGSSNIKHINLQHAATISEHVAEECTLNNVTNVDDFVQKILNEHLLLDEWFGHMVTDRAHLIALMYADYPEYVGTDGSRFKMRDAISKLCKEVQDNKDKYPLEYEQLMVRLSKVEGDLERKTNDYEKKFDKSSLSPEPEPVPEEEDEEEEEPKTIDESLDALLAQIKSDIDQNAHSTVLAKLSEIVNALQEKDIDKPTVQKILDLNDKLNQFATLNSITPSGLDKQQLKKLATDTTKGIIVQNKLATEELLESATIAELKSALAAAQKEYDDSPEKTGEVAGKFQKSRDNIYNASLGINSTIPAQVHGAAFFDIDEALFIAVRWCACNDAKNKYATSNKQVKDIKVYKNTIDGKCDLEVPILRLTEIRNEFNIEVLAELKKVIEKDGKISDGDDIETILELNRKLEKDQPGSGLSSELFEKLLAKNDDAVKLMLSDTHAQKVIKFEQVYAIKKDINTFNYYYNYLISVNRGEITAPTREQLGLLLKELPSSFPDYCFPQLKVISTVVNSKLLLPLVTKDCLESLKTAISSSSAKIKAEWGYGNNGEKLLSKIEERLKELAVAESKTVKIPAEINKSFDGKPAFPNQLQYNRINEYYMPYKVGGGAILAEAQAEIMLRDIKALLAQNPDLKIAITYSANDNDA